MTRAEHIQWCKDRAIKEIEQDDERAIANGIASFISDLNKHEETRGHIAIGLMMQLCIITPFTKESLKKFIQDTA